MGKNARIGPGPTVTIDTTAWLKHRVGPLNDVLTGDLRSWATALNDDTGQPATAPSRTSTFALGHRSYEWWNQTQTWRQKNGYIETIPRLIVHSDTRLDATVWIYRLLTGHGHHIVVIGLNDQAPTVYTDTRVDTWTWLDADSIDILCPNHHHWTWKTGRELLTRTGMPTTVTLIFGPSLDAPFTLAPNCTHDSNNGEPDCGCGTTPWILCPTCGQHCDVELHIP